MAKWIGKHLGPDTPLHFLRFRPEYRMRNLPPTPEPTLEAARREALDAGLHYVYIGNLNGHEAESTRCPRDQTLLIRRVGMRVAENHLSADGRCPTCRETIAGVWT
jgi:pyruvate formate lyase activating enzyme